MPKNYSVRVSGKSSTRTPRASFYADGWRSNRLVRSRIRRLPQDQGTRRERSAARFGVLWVGQCGSRHAHLASTRFNPAAVNPTTSSRRRPGAPSQRNVGYVCLPPPSSLSRDRSIPITMTGWRRSSRIGIALPWKSGREYRGWPALLVTPMRQNIAAATELVSREAEPPFDAPAVGFPSSPVSDSTTPMGIVTH
jgi:hypothetical protein